MQSLDDFGLLDRSRRFGGGDSEVTLRDLLYLSLERDRDELLPEDDEEMLRFRVFPSGDFSRAGEANGLVLPAFLLRDCDTRFSSTLDLFTLLPELEALLLLEELDEDPDELAELEWDLDLLELSALLSEEELENATIQV